MSNNKQAVVVTDINMPFGSMVNFMVKASLASIPAVIILSVLFTVISFFFSAILMVFAG